MAKPIIAVFSGANATISSSPSLVTSNKGRLPGEKKLAGRYDHLVPQFLYEPIKVKIRKFSAHPLEEDASDLYHDDGRGYNEAILKPEDGPYLLPYVSRRSNKSKYGTPFEIDDNTNAALEADGRQFFYPDASSIFLDIDRSLSGREETGTANALNRRARYEFVRVLPSGGYTKKGEIPGRNYFPYTSTSIGKRPLLGDLAKVANTVQKVFASQKYSGGIWLDSSAHLEETLYWLNLLIDTELPIVGVASQRAHGVLSADGDRNIVDAVDYILSNKVSGLGVVATLDQCIYAARDLKKTDDRPGNYKTTGGSGGILGSVKASSVSIWYRPNYKHTSTSELNLTRLPDKLEFVDTCKDSRVTRLQIKDKDGNLRRDAVPSVQIIKYGSYSQERESDDPEQEVEIMARIEKGLKEQGALEDPSMPKLHGFVFEGVSPYAVGSLPQMKALWIGAANGMPVVRVGRSSPGGRVVTNENDLTIEGSNLDATKARLLLMAAMLKLGRLPKARDPRNPTGNEVERITQKIKVFQEIFETH